MKKTKSTSVNIRLHENEFLIYKENIALLQKLYEEYRIDIRMADVINATIKKLSTPFDVTYHNLASYDYALFYQMTKQYAKRNRKKMKNRHFFYEHNLRKIFKQMETI